LARDPGNGIITNLRAGTYLGKVTATGFYANSFLGLTNGALTGASTTLTLASAAMGTELVRRVGATGTINLIGPPAASGVVRTVLATYSAVSGVSVTITAMGVNQVDQINIQPAATGGNIQFTIQKPDGTFVTTANAAWSATDATYLANINTQLDASSGVVGGIVATAIPAVDTDLGFRFTYSGGAYAGKTWVPAAVALLPTSATTVDYQPVTVATNGAFVTQSLVAWTDGSQNPLTFVNDSYGIQCVASIDSSAIYAQDYKFPVGGNPDLAQLLPYPADTSLRSYLMAQLKLNGAFVFKDPY
jgi:hypothetical protein